MTTSFLTRQNPCIRALDSIPCLLLKNITSRSLPPSTSLILPSIFVMQCSYHLFKGTHDSTSLSCYGSMSTPWNRWIILSLSNFSLFSLKPTPDCFYPTAPYQNCSFQALQQSPNVNPHSLSYLTYQTLTMVEHYFILETLPSQDTTSSHMLLLSLLTGPPNLPTFSCWSVSRLTCLELLFASYYLSIHIYIVLSWFLFKSE